MNEAEYELALRRIEVLMDAEPNTPDEEELDVLADLVEEYEETHYPIEEPSKLGLIKFRISQEGLIGYLTRIIKRRISK